jgi:hypothetical protein
MKKNKSTKRSLYILTEGITEQAYFSRISEILGDDAEWRFSVHVDVREIEEGSKTDAVGMVKEAKENINNYDEVWVVFDRDRDSRNKILEAVEIAKKWKIKIAFSSISFEEWVLLHFEKCAHAFERSDCESRGEQCVCNGTICVSTYLKQNYYPSYKKGKAKLYDELADKQTIALENTAWLRCHHSPNLNFYLLNPYTDVDVLVARLLEFATIRYEKINSVFLFV